MTWHVIDEDFTGGLGKHKTGAEIRRLRCPRKDGGTIDLSVSPGDPMFGGFTTHLLDPQSEHAYFLAWSPAAGVVFGYAWKRAEFSWLCRWEEKPLAFRSAMEGPDVDLRRGIRRIADIGIAKWYG
jgi:hypothetical protein